MALLDRLNDHDADANAGWNAAYPSGYQYGDFRTWMKDGEWYWQVQVIDGVWMPQDGQQTAVSDRQRTLSKQSNPLYGYPYSAPPVTYRGPVTKKPEISRDRAARCAEYLSDLTVQIAAVGGLIAAVGGLVDTPEGRQQHVYECLQTIRKLLVELVP